MAEKLEELQLPKAQVEIESRGAIYAVPFFKDAELEKPSPSPEDAPGPGTRHPPLDTSVSSGHPASATPFPTAPAVPEAGVPLSCGAKAGSPCPAEEDGGEQGQLGSRGHGQVEQPPRRCQGWGAGEKPQGRRRRDGKERSEAPVGGRLAPAIPSPPMEGAPTATALGSWCRAPHKTPARGHPSVPSSAGVQHAGSVPDRDLAARRVGAGRGAQAQR